MLGHSRIQTHTLFKASYKNKSCLYSIHFVGSYLSLICSSPLMFSCTPSKVSYLPWQFKCNTVLKRPFHKFILTLQWIELSWYMLCLQQSATVTVTPVSLKNISVFRILWMLLVQHQMFNARSPNRLRGNNAGMKSSPSGWVFRLGILKIYQSTSCFLT